jgi:hypothetical protein
MYRDPHLVILLAAGALARPEAVEPIFQRVLTTYASEANKTVSVWRAVPDDLLDFKPHEKTNSIRTILVHQLLSERRFFAQFVGIEEPGQSQPGLYLRPVVAGVQDSPPEHPNLFPLQAPEEGPALQPPGGGALRQLRQPPLRQPDVLVDIRLDDWLLAGRDKFFDGRTRASPSDLR